MVLHGAAWCCMVLHGAADTPAWCCMVLHGAAWCCMVLQIAKAQGAFVATTCSGRNIDFVRKLGADRPIDYTKER
jgi:NADPH-dependent curcumin reductase CurA